MIGKRKRSIHSKSKPYCKGENTMSQRTREDVIRSGWDRRIVVSGTWGTIQDSAHLSSIRT